MPTEQNNVQPLEPFFISTFHRPADARGASSPAGLPTPLLDPSSLKTAREAYDSALDELRTRNKAGLRPATCHVLANKILGFAIFGERDPRSLADRALAHFP